MSVKGMGGCLVGGGASADDMTFETLFYKTESHNSAFNWTAGADYDAVLFVLGVGGVGTGYSTLKKNGANVDTKYRLPKWLNQGTGAYGAGFNITCYICPVKSGEKYTASNTYGGNFQENGTGQETIVGVFALTNGS